MTRTCGQRQRAMRWRTCSRRSRQRAVARRRARGSRSTVPPRGERSSPRTIALSSAISGASRSSRWVRSVTRARPGRTRSTQRPTPSARRSRAVSGVTFPRNDRRNVRPPRSSNELMEAPRSDARSSVLRLALALPLACAVIIGALWLGQSLRTYREPAASPAPSEEPGPQAGASPAPQPLPPMQSIDLPPDVARNAGAPVPNADGTYLVGQTADYKSLAVIRLIADRDALNLKSEVVAAVADTGFLAWMPDGKSFIARGNTVVNTASGKAQMKMNDVFRVDFAGQRTKLGEAWLVSSSLSPDARLLAAFDGDMRLVVIRTDGGGTQLVANDQGGAPSLLGWDASGAILRFDERTATIHRLPVAGAALKDLPVNGARYIGGMTRWSPDRRAAIVSATVTTSAGVCECDRLLTDGVVDMPRDAFAVWVGPHTLLTRASDEHAGTVDALSGARATLNAKMRSEKIRIIAVSLPYVMWLDETKNVAHILDLAKDRDTGVGLNPSPAGAYPLNGGRFLWWRDQSLSILDMSAWWAFYVDAHPTPSPIPQSKDQSAVPAGYVRVERPEGGWSAVM